MEYNFDLQKARDLNLGSISLNFSTVLTYDRKKTPNRPSSLKFDMVKVREQLGKI